MTQSTDEIRADQLEHGRRETLHPKTGYQGKNPRNGNTSNKVRFNSAPAKPKGHDAILKDYQDTGKPICVEMNSGVEYIGTVTARDKFTISLDTFEGVRVIYKHAIDSFFPHIPVANIVGGFEGGVVSAAQTSH